MYPVNDGRMVGMNQKRSKTYQVKAGSIAVAHSTAKREASADGFAVPHVVAWEFEQYADMSQTGYVLVTVEEWVQ